MCRSRAGATASTIAGPARTGATTPDNSPVGVNDTTPLRLNFTGTASCEAVTIETVQHGAETQPASVAATNDGACPDALMEGMAMSFAMPCIDAPLDGRQQSGEELPSTHSF